MNHIFSLNRDTHFISFEICVMIDDGFIKLISKKLEHFLNCVQWLILTCNRYF